MSSPTGILPATVELDDQLQQYGATLPRDELVVQVNILFHSFDAPRYDRTHPEIRTQLPPLWQEMIQRARGLGGERAWRVLSFGCGTGFEALEVLRALPPGGVAELTCYDNSPEMIARCREKISPLFSSARFCASEEDVRRGDGDYDLLLTNSVLHHLPDARATLAGLLPVLAPDAIWLAGHEPSSRFYRNSECSAAAERFTGEMRREFGWRKFFRLQNYLRRLRKLFGLHHDPWLATAREALRRGWFAREPSPDLIDRLVDFAVPHSPQEVASGRGFDYRTMERDLADDWKLIQARTYGFMCSYPEGELPRRWARISRELAERFPDDGAYFCAVWQRKQE